MEFKSMLDAFNLDNSMPWLNPSEKFNYSDTSQDILDRGYTASDIFDNSERSHDYPDNSGNKRRAPIKKWTQEEDELLRIGILKYVKAKKPINYEEVALSIPGRSVKQAKERWKNSLNPTIRKGEWSNNELISLLDLVIYKAQNWTEIQKELFNRSMHCIKSKGRKLLGETLSKRLQKRCSKSIPGSASKRQWSKKEDEDIVTLHLNYLKEHNPGLLHDKPDATQVKLEVNKLEHLDVFEYACSDDCDLMLEQVCVDLGTGRPIAQIDRRLLQICTCRVCRVRKIHLDKTNVDFKIAWTQTKAKIVKLKLMKEIKDKNTHDKRIKQSKPKKSSSSNLRFYSSSQNMSDQGESDGIVKSELDVQQYPQQTNSNNIAPGWNEPIDIDLFDFGLEGLFEDTPLFDQQAENSSSINNKTSWGNNGEDQFLENSDDLVEDFDLRIPILQAQDHVIAEDNDDLVCNLTVSVDGYSNLENDPYNNDRLPSPDQYSTSSSRNSSRKRDLKSEFEEVEGISLTTPVRRLRKLDFTLDKDSQRTFELLVENALNNHASETENNAQEEQLQEFGQALTLTGYSYGTDSRKESRGDAQELLTMVRNYSRESGFSDSLARKVIQAFSEHFSEKQLSELHTSMKKNNIEWLNPSICFMLDKLKLTPNQNDIRYTKQYLCPEANTVFFDSQRPVGTYLVDFVSRFFVDADKESKAMARGSMINKHSWKFVPSRLEALLRIYYVIPRLFSAGEAWSYVRMYRCDGSQGIFLCKYELLSKEKMIAKVKFQDVSDDMKHVLLLPPDIY